MQNANGQWANVTSGQNLTATRAEGGVCVMIRVSHLARAYLSTKCSLVPNSIALSLPLPQHLALVSQTVTIGAANAYLW